MVWPGVRPGAVAEGAKEPRTRTWWCVSHQAGESEPTTRMRPAFRAQRLGAEPRHPELGTRGQVPHRPVVSEVLAGLGPELGLGLETETPEPVVLDTLSSGVPKVPFSPFSQVSAPREQEDGGGDPTCPVHCRVNAFTNFEWGEKKRLPCRHSTCMSLTLHDLPPTPKATSSPFYRCGSLTQVTCPSSLSVRRSPGPVVPVPPPHLWKGFLQGNFVLGVPLGCARFLPTSPPHQVCCLHSFFPSPSCFSWAFLRGCLQHPSVSRASWQGPSRFRSSEPPVAGVWGPLFGTGTWGERG